MGLKMWNRIGLIVLMPTLLSLGCGNKQEETALPSVEDPADPTDPDDAPPNVVNNLGFYVKVDTDDKYLAYMSKGATFNADCSIATSAATTQDISCRLDVQEGDLNFHDMKFNFNVPANMCPYVRMTPWFYWDWEPGKGPETITLDIYSTGGNTSVTSCTVETEGGPQAGCTGQDEVTIDTKGSGAVRCVYDHSKSGGPNCCFGDYEIVRNITGDSPGTETEEANWGGNYEGCLGGPGAHSWSEKTTKGFPKSLIYYAAQGVNEEWTVKSPSNSNLGSNLSVSNYYGDLNHNHSGFVDLITTSSLPYAFAPIDDRDGSPMGDLPHRLTYECLDTSFEVKHRIGVTVREWNTYTNFLAYVTSNGTTAASTANTGGTEDGVSCDYGIGSPEVCNDAADWDDLLNLLDGNTAVTTDTYNTGVPTNRSRFFPSEQNSN